MLPLLWGRCRRTAPTAPCLSTLGRVSNCCVLQSRRERCHRLCLCINFASTPACSRHSLTEQLFTGQLSILTSLFRPFENPGTSTAQLLRISSYQRMLTSGHKRSRRSAESELQGGRAAGGWQTGGSRGRGHQARSCFGAVSGSEIGFTYTHGARFATGLERWS